MARIKKSDIAEVLQEAAGEKFNNIQTRSFVHGPQADPFLEMLAEVANKVRDLAGAQEHIDDKVATMNESLATQLTIGNHPQIMREALDNAGINSQLSHQVAKLTEVATTAVSQCVKQELGLEREDQLER